MDGKRWEKARGCYGTHSDHIPHVQLPSFSGKIVQTTKIAGQILFCLTLIQSANKINKTVIVCRCVAELMVINTLRKNEDVRREQMHKIRDFVMPIPNATSHNDSENDASLLAAENVDQLGQLEYGGIDESGTEDEEFKAPVGGEEQSTDCDNNRGKSQLPRVGNGSDNSDQKNKLVGMPDDGKTSGNGELREDMDTGSARVKFDRANDNVRDDEGNNKCGDDVGGSGKTPHKVKGTNRIAIKTTDIQDNGEDRNIYSTTTNISVQAYAKLTFEFCSSQQHTK